MTLVGTLRAIKPEAAWDRLFDATMEPNPFFGPGFLLPYSSNMVPGQLALAVVEDAATGQWLMAAPVGRKRAGFLVPTATLWASEYGPLGTPLIHPDCPSEAVPVFLRAASSITALPGASRLDIPYLPLTGSAVALLRAGAKGWATAEDGTAARAAHSGGADGGAQLAEAWTPKRRKEFDRLARRLAELGDVIEESHRGPDTLDAFEAFLRLEASGWKGQGGTALLSTEQTANFSRSFIAAMAAQDRLRIDLIRFKGEAIAALVLVEHQGRSHAWKIAFDETLARFSPGQRVTLQALRTNIGDPRLTAGGDSLAVPGHPMIEPLWRGRMAYTTLRLSHGPLAAPLGALQGMDRMAHASAKRLYHRLRRR